MGSVAAQERAWRKLSIAEHILTQTYPLVHDPKLLLAVLQNIFESVAANTEAALHAAYERKEVETIPERFEHRLHLVAQRFRLAPELLRFVRELEETMHEHKKSPVEFARKNSFVICDDDYRLHTVKPEQLRSYIQHARTWHTQIGEQL